MYPRLFLYDFDPTESDLAWLRTTHDVVRMTADQAWAIGMDRAEVWVLVHVDRRGLSGAEYTRLRDFVMARGGRVEVGT